MLRFILKRTRYDGIVQNDLFVDTYTVDAECPELEKALRSGGFGGGPNNDSFERHELIAVEALKGSR
jgi:hypothetical protein